MEAVAEQPAAAGSEQSMDDRLLSSFYGEEQPQEDVEQQQPEQAGEQAVTEPTEPELADVAFNGKEYKLPPELKDALMAQSDYTQKTQEVAQQRKLVDLQAQTFQKQQQFQKAIAPELQNLGQLDMEIARYGKLDWAALDTDTMVRYGRALDMLKEQKAVAQAKVQEKAHEFEQESNKIRQQTIEKGTEYLKKVIPTWSEESVKDAMSWGTKKGYSDAFVSSSVDPIQVEAWYKAAQWDKLQSQKGVTQQKVKTIPPITKPGASENLTAKAQQDKGYQLALKNAKTSSEKARVVDQRLAQKLGL